MANTKCNIKWFGQRSWISQANVWGWLSKDKRFAILPAPGRAYVVIDRDTHARELANDLLHARRVACKMARKQR